MSSRFVRPETAVLKISDGDTITVKKQLSSGEQRAVYSRMYVAGADGRVRVNPSQSGLAIIVAYLVDWHGPGFADETGQPIVIRAVPIEELESTLDSLDPESFEEILAAVRAHESAILTARAEEKKLRNGTPGGEPISPSPSVLVGASSG